MKNHTIGLGNKSALLTFYIKNRPPLDLYQTLVSIKPLVRDEIAYICQETGNHWRKIFNVYAKLLFELTPAEFPSWQHLRDNLLLQEESEHCLLFSPPVFSTEKASKKLHVVLGKGYAEQLNLANDCTWLSNDFAINRQLNLIVCPYFDYRQLSNVKITQLSGLIRQMMTI
ncbi:MAG: hypothetical protein WBC60_04210 [Cognaticolwellia sp.]|jgi:hypothetical protein